jgi:hypothetical protein
MLILYCLLAATIITNLSPTDCAQTPSHTPPPGMKPPGDKIVWVNTRSGVYHFEGERYFGSTQEGKFMSEHDAGAEGNRPRRNSRLVPDATLPSTD